MSSAAGAIWINGQRQREEGAHVSARDRGFTLADGVFETMRLRNGCIFRRDPHLARLRHALRTLQIAEPRELPSWLDAAIAGAAAAAIHDSDDAGDQQDISVRLTVTRGVGPGGVAPPITARTTVAIAVSAWPSFSPELYDRGLTVVVATGRRNQQAMSAGLKTINYTDAVAALIEAQQRGADEALFLDTDGHCSEATASNLFVWTGTTLLTPPLACAALPGITRAAVIEICLASGIDVAETAFDLAVLGAGQEAFLTSSLRGIAPIATLDSAPIGTGRPGPVTRRIAAAYQGLVDLECRAGVPTPQQRVQRQH